MKQRTKVRLRETLTDIDTIIDGLARYVVNCRPGELSGRMADIFRQLAINVEIRLEELKGS